MLPSQYIYQERLRTTPMVQLGSTVDSQGNPVPPDSSAAGQAASTIGARVASAFAADTSNVVVAIGAGVAGVALGGLAAWLLFRRRRRH